MTVVGGRLSKIRCHQRFWKQLFKLGQKVNQLVFVLVLQFFQLLEVYSEFGSERYQEVDQRDQDYILLFTK
jgi:hypothetical protein